MHRIGRRAVAALAVALLAAGSAGAATFEVTYQITGGSFATPAPSGAITGGLATIRYTGPGPGTLSSLGAGTLLTLQVTGTGNRIALLNPLTGFLAPFITPGFLTMAATGIALATGPSLSGLAGGFVPAGSGFVVGLNGPTAQVFFAFSTYYASVSSYPGSVNVTGQEIARVQVPEPARSLALLAGLGALALGAAAWRSRGV